MVGEHLTPSNPARRRQIKKERTRVYTVQFHIIRLQSNNSFFFRSILFLIYPLSIIRVVNWVAITLHGNITDCFLTIYNVTFCIDATIIIAANGIYCIYRMIEKLCYNIGRDIIHNNRMFS